MDNRNIYEQAHGTQQGNQQQGLLQQQQQQQQPQQQQQAQRFKFQRERDYVVTINVNQNENPNQNTNSLLESQTHLNDIGLIGTKSIFQNHVRIACNDVTKKEINFDKSFIIGNMTDRDLETQRCNDNQRTCIQLTDSCISRMHVKVDCINSNKELMISDLGSVNGTYLCNPDDPADYELEIEKEFAIGDTTMIVTKKNLNTSDFCLYILDGYLSGVEFRCKCNANNSFFFRKGDLRNQINTNSNQEVNEQLFILDEETTNKNVRSEVEVKWEEKTKKLRVQRNDKIGFWIRISPSYYPGHRVKDSEKAVIRISTNYFVYINFIS